jgi:signal transduction histidine kinase
MPLLGLYSEIVARARAGVLVYHWDEPPDPGSLRLIILNEASTKLGSSADQLGRTIRESSPELLATPVAHNYVESWRTRSTRSWSIEWKFADARVVHYEAYCYPLDEEHLVVWFEDVSEKRRVEVELERHAKELQRSNNELDNFAYVASHDLKSPLRDIHNLAQWIGEDLGAIALPEGTKRHLGLLQDRIGRMERLLDDMLAYARAGRAEALPSDIDLSGVVSDIVALLTPHGFDIQVRASAPLFRAPRAAIELILRNLIANAVRHHDRKQGLIIVSSEAADDGWTILEVKDDGPGIAPEHHERVFRMFQALAAHDGSGMGLAVVRKLVDAHGGRVELISRGRGTAIRIHWPPERVA